MRCPDPPVHPAVSSALRGPLRALGALIVLAVCSWAVTALAPLWAAALLAEAAVAVAGIWAVQRLVRYGGWRKPRPAVTRVALERAPVRVVARAELTAPPKAIEAPAQDLTASQAPPSQAASRTVVARQGSRRASMTKPI